MSLHQSDLQRLAKLLGLLGSSHDGEALNAARKAHALVTEKGCSWFDALNIPEAVEAPQPAHHAQARDLLAHKGIMTAFERSFVIGILAHASLSEKQRATLEGIQRKVQAAAAA